MTFNSLHYWSLLIDHTNWTASADHATIVSAFYAFFIYLSPQVYLLTLQKFRQEIQRQKMWVIACYHHAFVNPARTLFQLVLSQGQSFHRNHNLSLDKFLLSHVRCPCGFHHQSRKLNQPRPSIGQRRYILWQELQENRLMFGEYV